MKLYNPEEKIREERGSLNFYEFGKHEMLTKLVGLKSSMTLFAILTFCNRTATDLI